MQRGTGVGGAFTGNKGTGVDNGGEAEVEITNVKFAPNGNVIFTEANGGKAQFQNEQQHVYHVGLQGQAVAEPVGSAVSAAVEETFAPAQSASAASVSTASVGSSVVALASTGATQSKSSTSSANTLNALPETGMANEGIEFAATMLALAGIAMVKREHEE